MCSFTQFCNITVNWMGQNKQFNDQNLIYITKFIICDIDVFLALGTCFY